MDKTIVNGKDVPLYSVQISPVPPPAGWSPEAMEAARKEAQERGLPDPSPMISSIVCESDVLLPAGQNLPLYQNDILVGHILVETCASQGRRWTTIGKYR